jgi:hypothetical protein
VNPLFDFLYFFRRFFLAHKRWYNIEQGDQKMIPTYKAFPKSNHRYGSLLDNRTLKDPRLGLGQKVSANNCAIEIAGDQASQNFHAISFLFPFLLTNSTNAAGKK